MVYLITTVQPFWIKAANYVYHILQNLMVSSRLLIQVLGEVSLVNQETNK